MKERRLRKTLVSFFLLGILMLSVALIGGYQYSDTSVYYSDFISLSANETGMIGEFIHFMVKAISFTLEA